MSTIDRSTARRILVSVFDGAGLEFSDADVDRLAGEYQEFLTDGQRIAEAVTPSLEPTFIPVTSGDADAAE